MKCPIFNKEECSPSQLQKLIQENKPCVIRGFFNKDTVSKYIHHINTSNQTKYMIGNVPAYMIDKKHVLPHSHVDTLLNDPLLVHSDVIRLWKHNAGNVTRWHYDGNGTDLLNISLSGSKQFYLAPPDSLPVYPLSSIALPIDFKETIMVELNPGDMLYIPSYWFHKVITTQDNTQNINYVMYNKNNPRIASSRHQELFMLHKLAKTQMDKEILDIHNTPFHRALTRGFIETLPLFLLIIIIYFALIRYSIKLSFIFILLLIMTSFILFGSRIVDTISSGMARLLGFYIFIYSIIILFVSIPQIQRH